VAFVTVNSARLYYETHGSERAAGVPIVLIHGSPNTGQYDWAEVAPPLAEAGYFVIVPDCRGHGQSENPQRGHGRPGAHARI
jgi:pimeloyl-ACP methyl ester carboxylesterase